MQFRRDINGLRAIAVIGVVLYHFNPYWVPGGFAGVDVFFVISGFLMTKIIFNGLDRGGFSVLNFYLARANRIIPALVMLCTVLLIFGWFLLTPSDFRALGKHVVGSVNFISNFLFFSEAGYFDSSSHEKWLLHTWSLSVEWQFYIIYPLLLTFLYKYLATKHIKIFLVALTVISFLASIVLTPIQPSFSYYLLPTRAWEMLFGGVVFLFPMKLNPFSRKVIEIFGVFLILMSYFLFSKSSYWPGYYAIVPVLGAFLVIQANANSSLLTSNVIFDKIGVWSYSIYLWHWPIVVSFLYFDISDTYLIIGVVTALFLGFLSHRYVEAINFKRDFTSILDFIKCTHIYTLGTLSLLGCVVFLSHGMPERFSSDGIITLALEAEKPSLLRSYDECFIADDRDSWESKKDGCALVDGLKVPINNPDYILIGDSHADAIAEELSISLQGKELLVISYGGCFLTENFLPLGGGRDSCPKHVGYQIERILDDFKSTPVIISQRYSLYINGDNKVNGTGDKFINVRPSSLSEKNINFELESKNLLNEFKNNLIKLSQDRKAYIISPIPEMTVNIPKSIIKDKIVDKRNYYGVSRDDFNTRNKEINTLLKEVDNISNVKVIDASSSFCDSVNCDAVKDNNIIYRDADHLSSYGARELSRKISKTILVFN
ncbi:Acyltransferase [Vibrio chagasii]|nr:Acyltransferase [Vibrio chagasii]